MFWKLLPLAAFVLLGFLLACDSESDFEFPAPTSEQQDDLSGLMITMSRGACLGPCPVYTITIHEDGRVDYHGTNSVGELGLRTGSVTLDDLRQLVQSVEDIHFFDIPGDSDCLTTDVPRTITSVQDSYSIEASTMSM